MAAVASAVLLAGCAAGGHQHPGVDKAAVTAHFGAMGVAFGYPGAWRSGTWSDDVSSFSGLIVSLSTGRQHDPCQRTVDPGLTSVSCGSPVGRLQPGGIFAEWTEHGFPGWHAPRPNTTIGGRPATESVTAGGWCRTLDGTRTITVIIPNDTPSNWYQLDARLRGPGIPSEQAEITAMLASVRFTPGS